MQIVIDIPEELASELDDDNYQKLISWYDTTLYVAIKNGIPLTPNVLADMLMEERITGSLEQNMSCSRDVIDNVRCKLTVEIIDRRPCYCGAELRAVWRERKENAE